NRRGARLRRPSPGGRGDARAAARGPAPPGRGGRRGVSPRASSATAHELSRSGLLSSLPGETLVKLGQRMTREDVASGAAVIREGDDGDRFYVVLSGVLATSQESRGPRGLL